MASSEALLIGLVGLVAVGTTVITAGESGPWNRPRYKPPPPEPRVRYFPRSAPPDPPGPPV